jgi:RNA polymerase sigma factor (sigma-70 family)
MTQDLTALASQAGCDPAAFTALYDRCFPRVYNYIRYRVDETAAVEDLTAQVFEQVLSSIGRYAPEQAPFEAWLFGIVRHVVGSALRRARFSAWLPWEAYQRRPAPGPLPEEIAVQRDLKARLGQALLSLPDRQRDLLGLKFAAGLNNRQIAALAGLSQQNVGVILYRAIGRLRERMGEKDLTGFGKPVRSGEPVKEDPSGFQKPDGSGAAKKEAEHEPGR